MRRVQEPMLHVSSNISCDYVTCVSLFSTCVTPRISRHLHPEGELVYIGIRAVSRQFVAAGGLARVILHQCQVRCITTVSWPYDDVQRVRIAINKQETKSKR